jgi:methionine-rich copper-binding protein CopC
MRSAVLRLLAAMAWLGCAGGASAHALLERASPRVGSQVSAAPPEVRLTFSEPLEGAFSRLTITGPPGFGGGGQPRLAPVDRRILVADLGKPAPAGRYDIHWRVVSVDGHVTQGDFHFAVKP